MDGQAWTEDPAECLGVWVQRCSDVGAYVRCMYGRPSIQRIIILVSQNLGGMLPDASMYSSPEVKKGGFSSLKEYLPTSVL